MPVAKDNSETCPSIKDDTFKLRGGKLGHLMNAFRHSTDYTSGSKTCVIYR